MATACAGVALAGCGSQRTGAGAPGGADDAVATTSAAASPPSVTPQQRAAADAAGLLAAFPVPPGAVRTAALPVSWLSQPPESLGSTDTVKQTGWWRVAGQPATVLGWIRAHMPSGFTLEFSGTGGLGPRYVLEPAFPHPGTTQHGVKMWFAQFTKPSVPEVLSARWLVVSVAADGTGQTAIRVDSEVAWVPGKPAGERIQTTATTVVTVAPVVGNGPVPAYDQPVTISDPAKVAEIAAIVNGLPLFPVGRMMCPMDRGPSMRLTFRAAPAGPVAAVVTAGTTGCQTVAVTINGHPYPTLGGADPMEQQVMTIAGAHWPGFPAA